MPSPGECGCGAMRAVPLGNRFPLRTVQFRCALATVPCPAAGSVLTAQRASSIVTFTLFVRKMRSQLVILGCHIALCAHFARADFLWGTATAAYQVEGSRNMSSRQPSIWDCFDTEMTAANGVRCEAIRSVKPSKQPNVYHNENAATADSDFTNYNETVQELTNFGFGAYRMSISWTRVMSYSLQPDGTIRSAVNQEGVS